MTVYYAMAKHSSQVFVGAICPYPVEDGILCLCFEDLEKGCSITVCVNDPDYDRVLVLIEPFK